MNTWFTADTHFNHKGILVHRTMFSNVEEMNKKIIDNFNSVVYEGDTLYILGDFTFTDKGVPELYTAFDCFQTIIFLKGNHDKSALKKLPNYYMNSCPVAENQILERKFMVDGEQQTIVMCHYAMRSWNKSHCGSWHLYGHSHGMLPPHGLSFDVGVDTNDYYPYSLEDVTNKMKTLSREFVIKEK